eukprot:scaffold5.g790.t1
MAEDPLVNHPRYRTIRHINKGSFGFVVLARNLETNEEVAVKLTRVDSESDMKHSHREIMNHQQLLHPHVVQLKEVFALPPYLAIVMEYVPNGDMFQARPSAGKRGTSAGGRGEGGAARSRLLGSTCHCVGTAYVVSKRGLPEAEARWFFQQLMLGMDYCHKKGVMSRDIKLENTLLVLQPDKKPLLKLCDFGYSKHELMDSVAKSKVGTPGYTAPEVIQNVRGYDGKMADIWSAGVMLYTMLFARYPFERCVDYDFPEHAQVSAECRDLISKVLVANPAQRLTIRQIAAHPWFQTDLPPGSLEYNDWALQLKVEPAQKASEVHQASRGGGAPRTDDDLAGSTEYA